MGRRKKSPLKPSPLPKSVAATVAASDLPAAEKDQARGDSLESPSGKNGSSSLQQEVLAAQSSPAPPIAPVSATITSKEGSLTPQPLDDEDTAWPPLSRALSSNGKTPSPEVTRTRDSSPWAVSPNLGPALNSPTAVANQAHPDAAIRGKIVISTAAEVSSHLQDPQQNRAPMATPISETGKIMQARQKSWADCVADRARSLQLRGERYQLDSGERCVTIPNSVIARNKKVWTNFVLGQFHGTLPSMGALHAILNGIWSSKQKDISISRVGNQSVLIKIPNSATRKRVLDQGIWHIEGQTMFVGAWEPGLKSEIPEIKEIPVWVDFKGVPPHFFSAEGLEYIASLVGQPLQLHPRTEAMLNLEVARVFTLVDLHQDLPEVVYVRFESGELHKIEVSCQWLPPKCTHCHQFGHSLRRCPAAPIRCVTCRSTTHDSIECNRIKSKTRPQVKLNGHKAQQWRERPPQAISTSNVVAVAAAVTHPMAEAATAPVESPNTRTQVPSLSQHETLSPVAPDDEPQMGKLLDADVRSEALSQDTSVEAVQTNQVLRIPKSAPSKRAACIKEPALSGTNPVQENQDDQYQKDKNAVLAAPLNQVLKINEPSSEAPLRRTNRLNGKGKAKVQITEPSFSESDSYDLTDDDFNDYMLLSKLKQKSGKKAKGRVSSVQLLSKCQ